MSEEASPSTSVFDAPRPTEYREIPAAITRSEARTLDLPPGPNPALADLLTLTFMIDTPNFLQRMKERHGDITSFFISQRIMPPIVLAIPFFLMLRFLGLLDTLPGLILIYVAMLMPIAVWVMVDFFNSVPRGLDEMAWMDGCTPVTTFLRVILPNALPGLVVAAMFCLIFGWNDFFFAFTMTFTEVQLLPVSIVALNSSVTPWWSLSAAAIVSVAPLAVLAFVVERFLSRGGLAGAVR